MIKEGLIFRIKDHSSIPTLVIRISDKELASIQEKYPSVDKFAETIMLTEINVGAALVDDIGLNPDAKNSYYKFLVERDFEERFQNLKKENAEKNYQELYQQLSNLVFGESTILKQLFYWIRVNHVEQIETFLQTENQALCYLLQYNLDGYNAITYCVSYRQTKIKELFYKFYCEKVAIPTEQPLTFVEKVKREILFQNATTLKTIVEEQTKHSKYPIVKMAANVLLQPALIAAELNDVGFLQDYFVKLNVNKQSLHGSQHTKLEKITEKTGIHPLLGTVGILSIAAFYGHSTLARFCLRHGIYNLFDPEIRSQALLFAAAGGNFEIFQTMFVSFENQMSIYNEITLTKSLQNYHFSIFEHLHFLLIAIGMGHLHFLRQFSNLVSEEEKLLEEKDIPAKDKFNFEKYSQRVWTLVAENTSPWPHLGKILTAKTVALCSGILDVVNFISKERNYSWQQQFSDIERFIGKRRFNELFPSLPFNSKFNDIENVILQVCVTAISAILKNFNFDIQLQLFRELAEGCAEKYSNVFKTVCEDILKQWVGRNEANLLELFLASDKENQNNNSDEILITSASHKRVCEERDQKSAEVLSQVGTFSSKNSPKKQKQQPLQQQVNQERVGMENKKI